MASDKSVITWIFISVLVDLLGFTVILPLFPALLERMKDFFGMNIIIISLS